MALLRSRRTYAIILAAGMMLGSFASMPATAQVRELAGMGPIIEKPPGELATIVRRDPDFSTVRFTAMQRDFRQDVRSKLFVGHTVVRLGRPVAPMAAIEWSPSGDE